MYSRISALLTALVLAATAVAAQERFGTLTGTVTDQQGVPVPGVTVVIANTVTGESRTFVTDVMGQYIAPDLNPGRYTVAFELSGFTRVERTDISVLLGRTFVVDAQLRVGQVTETVQVTAERAPLVDLRSTVVGHNVTSEEIDRLPKTRTFQSLALTAPSVNQGEVEGGFQVNGASGAENAFTVDGVVTNSLINGQSRQNTVFEYLQEVQVKTSGISAEYGGALGGVVSAVTKSGGNVFRGETHYFFEGSPLYAAPVKRLVLDPVGDRTAFFVRDEECDCSVNEFGGSVGGPIVRDRLFFFGSYSPRNQQRTQPYRFTDGSTDMSRDIWQQQVFGKLTYAMRRGTASWSALWTPTTADGTLQAYNGATPNSYIGTQASLAPNIGRGYETNQVNTSGTFDLSLTNAAFLSFRGGYFHDRYSDTGIPQTTSYTYQTPTTSLDALVPASLRGGTGTSNTPRAQITNFDTTKRSNFNVDYNHAFNAAGAHTLKGGWGFQRTTNDINTYYPGGYVFLFWDRTFAFGGQQLGRGEYGYYEVHDRRITNKAGSNIHSLYIQDQWTVKDRLTLNLGLRTENEKVPTFRPEYLENAIEFGFEDKLAPRLGAAYDLFGDGRMKLYGSWGLYYDWTKYELPRGSFGAETWCINYRALDTLDLGSLNLNNMPGRDLWVTQGSCRDRRVPSFANEIDPELEPMRQSSTSAGFEYQLARNAVLTIHYVHNDLLETIEDVGFLNAQGDEGYLISNPGKRQAAIQFPTGATPLGQPIPRPKRQYDAVTVGYNKRFADNWFLSGNYTLSRLYGNYAGLASSDEVTTPTTGVSSTTAQQQTGSIARPGGNVNRAWDLDELLFDSYGNLDVRGRLATDRPHVGKLYGAYEFDFGSQVGAFFYAGSGTPISTYVTSVHSAESFVEGRGNFYDRATGRVITDYRTPVLTRTDLLLAHTLNVMGTRQVRVELNVQNVFNQKTTRHIFNFLNRGAGIDRGSSLIDLTNTNLLNGYDYNALIMATPDGANAYEPRYGMPDLFEDGTRAYVTVKFQF
ncbi:MAG: TonB-dependent receptor [Acidobacteria bacterium]|nr:TonB-dependent receptor [Acidobacteriota bacterium]